MSDGDGTTNGGFTSKHKVLSGALLAAGAAYLYKRAKNKRLASWAVEDLLIELGFTGEEGQSV